MATGYHSKAIGDYSQAFGYKASAGTASADSFATAIGYQANATGKGSFAVGYQPNATGQGAFALGDSSTASGDHSIAIGAPMRGITVEWDGVPHHVAGASATKDNAVAIGPGCVADGVASLAMGTQSSTTDSFAVAIGFLNDALNFGATVSGGQDNDAEGKYSTIGGGWMNFTPEVGATVCGGIYNWAMANYTFIGGGDQAEISDTAPYSSVVGGNLNFVDGPYGFIGGGSYNSIGDWNNASTHSIILGGYYNQTYGDYSTILGGSENVADSYHETVLGRFSEESGGNISQWIDTDPLFVIANGTADNKRRNALTLYKNGNLIIRRDKDSTLDSSFVFEDGNVGIGTTNPSQQLTVYNGSTTGTYTTNGWQHSSDRRLKNNITRVDNPLEKVNAMNGVYFNWKDKDDDRQIGVIAQDLIDILPEVVGQNGDGYYSVSYDGIIPILIEAVKEQQQIIQQKTSEIDQLKADIEEIKMLLEDRD
jgi:hypothetical protein